MVIAHWQSEEAEELGNTSPVVALEQSGRTCLGHLLYKVAKGLIYIARFMKEGRTNEQGWKCT